MQRRLVSTGVAIGLLVALGFAGVASTLRITQATHGAVHAVPGQVLQVRLDVAGADVISSQAFVVKPIVATSGVPRTFYFLAALPGAALLRAEVPPCNSNGRCLAPFFFWAVEVDVI